MKAFTKLLAIIIAVVSFTLIPCSANVQRTDKPFISGYAGFEFRPENNMTRAEACTVVTRLLVDEKTLDSTKSTAFTDLNSTAWYYKYVTYLEELGCLGAYSGEFYPDQKITRAEFVELIYNIGKISGGNKEVSFKDVPESHPRYTVITAAAKAGLVNGKTADTFDPDGDIKRSEVVKILCMALGRTPDKTSFVGIPVAGFCDVPDNHWAYSYVLEAAFEHICITDQNNTEKWVSVNDTNNYFTEAPDGLLEKLNELFEERKNEILKAASEWTVAPGGTVWYISNSAGDNANDGTSPNAPLKTFAKIHRMQDTDIIKSGDVVLFKRGDEWHGKFICKAGVTYSAYGEGPKPRILGSTEADENTDWKETEFSGVYEYAYTISADRDVGNIVFNDGEYYSMRIMKSPDEDITLQTGDNGLVGNGKETWLFPVQPFSGYGDIARIANETPNADLMYYHDHANSKLYLYSRNGNPGDRFDSIELCTNGHAVTATSDVTIDNLCVKYSGAHGIRSTSCKNLTVRNCEIGFIGGCIQGATTLASTTRFGNAVEIYGAADGYYVYNNYIYQCFDCGPTVQWQGNPGGIIVEKDVHFYDNVIRDASLEVWLSTNEDPTDKRYARLENCRMYNNLVTGSGTGFKSGNHQKQEWCAFYGGPQTKAYYVDCYIENNYFWDNKRHLMKAVPTSAKGFESGVNGFIWRGNIIIHPKDAGSIGYLGEDSSNASGKPIQYFYDEDTVNALVKNGTFAANKFYYTPGDISDRRIATGIYK